MSHELVVNWHGATWREIPPPPPPGPEQLPDLSDEWAASRRPTGIVRDALEALGPSTLVELRAYTGLSTLQIQQQLGWLRTIGRLVSAKVPGYYTVYAVARRAHRPGERPRIPAAVRYAAMRVALRRTR